MATGPRITLRHVGATRRWARANAASNARGRAYRSDDGDTLIEVLVAVTIVALVGVALITAFLTSIAGSAAHRSYAAMGTILSTFVEDATNQIQLGPTPLYASCAPVAIAGGAVTYNGTAISYSPPSGYALSSVSATYWNGTSFGSCPSGSTGPQTIVITATGPKGNTALLSFVVADPAYSSLGTSPSSTTTTVATTTTTAPAPLTVTNVSQFTCGGSPCGASSTAFATSNGGLYIVLLYEHNASAPPTVTVATGSSTPFTSCGPAAQQVVASGHSYAVAITCTGNGVNAKPSVTIGASGPDEVTVQVLHASTGASVALTGVHGGTSATASATLSSASAGDGEVALIATDVNNGTITPPSGMSLLGVVEGGGGGGGYTVGAYFDAQAVASSSFALSASNNDWGTIALELNP